MKPYRGYETCFGTRWERIDGVWYLNGKPRHPGIIMRLFFMAGRFVDFEWPLW